MWTNVRNNVPVRRTLDRRLSEAHEESDDDARVDGALGKKQLGGTSEVVGGRPVGGGTLPTTGRSDRDRAIIEKRLSVL